VTQYPLLDVTQNHTNSSRIFSYDCPSIPGGAKIILGTVPSGKVMGALLGGLAVNGKVIMIGVSDESIEVPPTLFILGRRSVMHFD
jgi:D-arabinose 1-dehydrogenase-like Zn-dependent alcohol dehydrogenase